ncbi:MAG: hypothetical protein ABI395_12360 [Sphingobium sp.]
MAGISSNIQDGPYNGDGIQTVFPFSFWIATKDEITVEMDGQAVLSNFYRVTFNDDGGAVTFLTPPAPNAQILLRSNPDYRQASSFENEGAYNLATVNLINKRAAIRDLVLKGRLDSINPEASAEAAASALFAATQATHAAGSALEAQNASTALASATATFGVYKAAGSSFVPQGAVAFTLAPGSGGTNGLNIAATFSGGNYLGNPTILFDIVGGAVTNVRLTDPGLYFGAAISAPTVILPGAAGGATLTLTNGSRIGLNSGYWAQSADGNTLDRYKNVGGVATADPSIASIPTSVALAAALAATATVYATGRLADDTFVGARAAAILPAAQAATVSGTHFTLTTSGANIPVTITGDQLGDTTTTVTASLQIVSGSAGTAFTFAIGRWYNSAGAQIGTDVALARTATEISFTGIQPTGARSLQFAVVPPATTVCRFLTYQFGRPARPTTDPWYLSLLGSGIEQNDPTPIPYIADGANWNPIRGRYTVQAASFDYFQISVPSGVNDGDVLWVLFDSPLEPGVWLQYVTAVFGSSGGNGGNQYQPQVLHVRGNRYAVALYVQSAGGGAFYGPRWTYYNPGAATYFENIKLYVGPNPPFMETVPAIALKRIRDEVESARIKPLITLADDSCGISSTPHFLPDPGQDLAKFFGVSAKFQNFATPGNTLAQSCSTVGLLPIHVSVSGGVIPPSTNPVSITAWNYDPITALSATNPEYDGYAYLCGVLGLITAGGYSGVTPTSLFFTPVNAPTWPIKVPAGSKLILRASRKRKGGLTLFPLSSVNGIGGGFATAVALADVVFAANDPATIAGFVGLTPSPYDTGAPHLAAFVGKSYYGRLYNPNVMSAATVAEAQMLFGWNWTGTENADWLAGNIGIPGSMRYSGDGFHPTTDVAAYVLAKNHFISAPVTAYLEAWS